jgi:hypothetical protein
MDVVLRILLFGHFIGLASLLGGYITQLSLRNWRVGPAMVHGALTQLVTGVAMVGIISATRDAADVNNAKFAVKLLVLLVILALVWANRSKTPAAPKVFQAIGALTVADIAIAVFWT